MFSFSPIGIWIYKSHFYGESKRPFSENSKQYLTKTIYFSEILFITNLGIIMHENQILFICVFYLIFKLKNNLNSQIIKLVRIRNKQ